MYLQKVMSRKTFFLNYRSILLPSWGSVTKIAGSGLFIIQRHVFADLDPDPYQNVMDRYTVTKFCECRRRGSSAVFYIIILCPRAKSTWLRVRSRFSPPSLIRILSNCLFYYNISGCPRARSTWSRVRFQSSPPSLIPILSNCLLYCHLWVSQGNRILSNCLLYYNISGCPRATEYYPTVSCIIISLGVPGQPNIIQLSLVL